MILRYDFTTVITRVIPAVILKQKLTWYRWLLQGAVGEACSRICQNGVNPSMIDDFNFCDCIVTAGATTTRYLPSHQTVIPPFSSSRVVPFLCCMPIPSVWSIPCLAWLNFLALCPFDFILQTSQCGGLGIERAPYSKFAWAIWIYAYPRVLIGTAS